MTSREIRLLLVGLLAGALLAGLMFAFVGRQWPRHGTSTSPGTQATAPQITPTPTPEPTAEAMTEQGTRDGASSAAFASVELTDEEQRAIGVETAEVLRRRLRRDIDAVGKVEEAETRLSTISARVGGRLDKLFVNFTGQSVRRAEPIALIYSPEVVASAEEYKLALENRRQLGAGALPQAVAQADDLIAASRRRLELWGLTSEQIGALASSKEPKIHITIYSPTSGIITERKVAEGQYVREGDVLYTLTDLGTVWVIAEVYESDLPLVRIGQPVEITSEALPGTKLRGRVSFLEPMVNQQTRTTAARIQVANPEMRLRPGMFVRTRLFSPSLQPVLAVPRAAVLQAAARDVVYVAKGGGVFEGREVKLGPPAEDYYPVLSGLQQGERVVTHGNFMIDSQTRITGGMTGLFGGSKEFERPEQGRPAPAANLKITFRTDPDPPKGAVENTLHVSVLDPTGKPVSDAQVAVTFVMPAMPSMGMPEMRASAELAWSGTKYTGKINIPMAGPWNVTVAVRRGGQALGSYRASVTAR